MKLKVLERDIQKSILDLLRLKGYFTCKINTTGIYKKKTDSWIPNPNRGCPDILAFKQYCAPLGIEVKSKNGVQSQDQKEWGKEFENHGGVYLLARDIQDIIGII